MHQTRRAFIGTLPALAVALPELTSVRLQPDATAGMMVVAPPGEPGQPLVVTGTIVGANGTTPLANIRLSVYHTDAAGYYARPVDNPRQARLRGSLVTDASGRYEIRTIWPGHYPGGGNPRHIHVHLAGPDVPEHWIDSFLFEGDKYLGGADARRSGQAGARFAYVMSMTRGADGLIRCTRDIRLDREIAERNRLVGGWYRNGEDS